MNRHRRNGELDVLPELTEYVFKQLPVVLYTSLVLSALVTAALWGMFPGTVLLSWLAAVYMLSMLRFMLYHWHRLVPEGPFTIRQWLQFYSLGAVLSGVVWGVMPLLFYSNHSPPTNLFIAFVIGGLVSGASSSMALLRATVRAFTALTCLPIALLFLLHGDRLHMIMGTMILIFGGAYLLISANTARMMIESFTLRKENLHEIKERRKAETELRMIQQGLEETVTLRTMELRTANEELSKEVDERLQVESKLRVSEERYRSLVESSSDWIWEVDRDGRYTYASPSVFSMLGYAQHEVSGRMFFDFMPTEEADRVKAVFNANVAGRKAIEGLVIHCLHKNGTEHIIETNGEPVFEIGGAFIGYRGIHRDITHRTRHEAERRKVEHLESLGLLAGGIAHDFNNLLMAILGNIELARVSVPEGSDAGKALADAVEAMSPARRLTGQLLTFSRGGSPILEATSVRDLILDSCRFVFSGTAVRCEYDIADGLWMADIDSGQIWQVLNNILTNAREAMSGGGTLWVRAENVVAEDGGTPGPGRFVRISIRDQGVGIPRENIPRVFDPYFSTKDRGSTKGTGIGLAVCYSIIEKHGGHITLTSELGRGTTVAFFLKAIGAGSLAKLPAAALPETTRGRGRVLMLEDDPVVVRVGTRMLDRLGYCVTAVGDGAAAIERYARAKHEAAPFDLVLLDLTIRGGMGGRETLEKLKDVDPEVVAVVTSGYADDPVVAEFWSYGFRAALVKPFSIKTLEKIFARLMSGAGRTKADSPALKRK